MSTRTQGRHAVKIEPRRVSRPVKHVYTSPERQAKGDALATHIEKRRQVEGEFEHAKAGFKARVATEEENIDRLSHELTRGFEYREEPCLMVLHPPTKKRYIFLESTFPNSGINPDDEMDRGFALAVEDMVPSDFQQELPIAAPAAAKTNGKEPHAVKRQQLASEVAQ